MSSLEELRMAGTCMMTQAAEHVHGRGLVACANENTPHSNGSQFFLTLGKAEGLDRKHTIFGSITGESIYNLAALNDLEVRMMLSVGMTRRWT